MAARIDYHRYLASREWAVRREAVKKRAKGKCERCGLLPLRDVHHLTYAHIGSEPLEDLQGICKPCHEYESGVFPFDPNDIADWASATAFPQDMMEDRWGMGWKDQERIEWQRKYGQDWELWFLRFCLLNPDITNLNLEESWEELFE